MFTRVSPYVNVKSDCISYLSRPTILTNGSKREKYVESEGFELYYKIIREAARRTKTDFCIRVPPESLRLVAANKAK